MPIQARPEVEQLADIPHGGFNSRRRPVLDFSANVNPFGPSPRIWDVLREVPIGRHPDPRAAPLRQFLAEVEGLDPPQILVGNGSIDLIYHLAVAYLRPGDRVLVVEPTFGEYTAAARMMGAEIVHCQAQPVEQFRIDLGAVVRAAEGVQPRLLFLCNPNNPTGTYLEHALVEGLLAACPDTLVVLDEAFVRFVDHPWSALDLLRSDHLLILRSLTKDYALTGLRVGYALAASPIIRVIENVQPPWSVNAMAQAAAIIALQDQEHLNHTLAALRHAKDHLVAGLVERGMAPLPSAVHYFLLPVHSAAEVCARLVERDILLRDCTSFGLPTFVRIATQREKDNAALLRAFDDLGDVR
jgi:histidinol-phosphate aminotransferase